ncbi:MAG: type II CRISPR RNA-guided endonuclease Cas9 [Chitinispirillales bacterium]|jgi:CRISPR-associated endonuclease Csn1|nr:type II CRISPR RNA-guided endonuclease Cas9 [Chitinispirillales bacterium]
MKKILGLDLGTNSIGWALINEAENSNEKSSIVKLGVRVNPLTVDEQQNFEKGKSITTNADRTLKRSMRRNLQRYKLRRANLIEILKKRDFISDETVLSENGNRTTFETYRLRAKAATEEISLEQFARVLLMINKKRGYKSSRKGKNKEEDGALIDGMEIAKKLSHDKLTPGQYCLQLLENGKKSLPDDFYRSDLQTEFDRIWTKQKEFYPEILTDKLKDNLKGKNEKATWAICKEPFDIVGVARETKGDEQKKENYIWRVKALAEKMYLESLAVVLQKVNAQISGSSGYLGNISDKSKELFFKRLTVGQYQMDILDKNPNASLKNMIFYRQDYLDEFNRIWETQAKFHKELTDELKHEIRDVVIFYQRRLKSQKGLISFCEFESRRIEVEVEGKKKTVTTGNRVAPRSSPLFQEFKIWQVLNNIEIADKSTGEVMALDLDEKKKLFAKLQIAEKLTPKEALETLFEKKAKNYELLNYKEKIEGNRTRAKICEVLCETLTNEKLNELWHLLYSWEGENDDLSKKLILKYGCSEDIAKKLSNITLSDDYGSLSSKAIKKILPYLEQGKQYDKACELAGYRHSKSSLTKEEIENKVLKDKLKVLPKNSLRNPVVEKILNQMVHVVNGIIDAYGKPDEIRIELARELKKTAKQREELTKSIADTTKLHEHYKEKVLSKAPFNLPYISRADIIRYKLYEELKDNGYKTLYSNTYISQEDLFSGKFDVEHIIPQSRLFDDSFSNKTLELKDINIEKGSRTAHDFVKEKYGESENDNSLDSYLKRIEKLYKDGKITRAKYNKLKMSEDKIPDGFINRDLANTQYITKKAKEMLEDLVKESVVCTTGSITDRLREDWQLVDVMQELNWDKYNTLGLTYYEENRDGKKLKRIKDWTKRNDHRHHAMDALTVAFTKRNIVQYLNSLNARNDKSSTTYGIEQNELYRNDKNKLLFKPPFVLDEFRSEVKKYLENTLISIKAKNKVVTQNVNTTQKSGGTKKKVQQTPRGQLHLETVYGSCKKIVINEEPVNAKFDEIKILTVTKPAYREALLRRLRENGNDPKKAFTGKNSLSKNPVWLDELHTQQVPEKVKTSSFETVYTIRKQVSHDLNIDKVIDDKVKLILNKRLQEFGGDAKKAFANIDEKPIWLNEKKGISIKRVTISGVSNAESLHHKRDKDGNFILDENGSKQSVDFVNTGNNHHVAVYRDAEGNLQEKVISFFEAVERRNKGLPIIDKSYKKEDDWQFLFSMKQNEYFVFPNEETGFNPKDTDLLNSDNYALISQNLFRVQKISSKNYLFNHHLETKAITGDDLKNKKQLSKIAYNFIQSLPPIANIVKVRIDHIGQIVSVGEY